MIYRTDGKRKVTISPASYEPGHDITVCRNGYQSFTVTVDPEMSLWLLSALSELHNAAAQREFVGADGCREGS